MNKSTNEVHNKITREQNINSFFKEHLAFLLTISITYILGIIFVIIQYFIQSNGVFIDSDISNILAAEAATTKKTIGELMLNSLIPTTITYVLGCILVNIVDMLKNKSDYYSFNIFTCLAVFIYAFIFVLYIITGYSLAWVVGESFATLGILLLNVLCYKEKYKHRNHQLG